MKKVLHISTFNVGGAGVVLYLHHNQFKKEGYYSKILVKGMNCKKDSDVIFYFNKAQILILRILSFINRILTPETKKKYNFFHINEAETFVSAKNIIKKARFNPDIIIFYWISGFINTKVISNLFEITNAKLNWVVTDMSPYTGGCHYSWNCAGFTKECSHCPALPNGSIQAYKNLALKKRNLMDVPIEIIASPGDSVEFARSASIFKNKKIHENILKVKMNAGEYSTSEARNYLKLPLDKTILLFGATNIEGERKGMNLLIEALNLLYNQANEKIRDEIHIIIAGKRSDAFNKTIPFSTTYLGILNFEKELPLAYIAADAHLSSTIMDTGPYMVNLSIFYGCPVIAFNIGIARKLVINSITGFLSTEITATDYCTSINKFISLDKSEIEEMKIHCKQFAIKNLSWNSSSLKIFEDV